MWKWWDHKARVWRKRNDASFFTCARSLETFAVCKEGRMSSHLNSVSEWIPLGRNARYRPAELARICQVSPRQLQRFFHRRFRQVPRQWLDALRLNEAPDLLLQLNIVKQAAYELGFRHPSHFIRKFKWVYGCTPMEFLCSCAAVTAHQRSLRLPNPVPNVAGPDWKSRLGASHRPTPHLGLPHLRESPESICTDRVA